MKRLLFALIGIMVLGAFGLVASAFFYTSSNSVPHMPTRTVTHGGFSIDVPETAYVCHNDLGAWITLSGPAPKNATECSGPVPDPEMLVRSPKLVRVFLTEDADAFVTEEDCPDYLKQGGKRRNGRTIHYSICSAGGGSGGLEYQLDAVVHLGDQSIAAYTQQQDEWGPPSFDAAFNALATADIAE